MNMTFKIIQNILLLILVGCNNSIDGNLKITSNITNTIKSNEVVKISINEPFDSIKISDENINKKRKYTSGDSTMYETETTLNTENDDHKYFNSYEKNIFENNIQAKVINISDFNDDIEIKKN